MIRQLVENGLVQSNWIFGGRIRFPPRGKPNATDVCQQQGEKDNADDAEAIRSKALEDHAIQEIRGEGRDGRELIALPDTHGRKEIKQRLENSEEKSTGKNAED